MIVNWNAMSYLTAIKDYKSILYSFAAAVLVAFVTSCVLLTTLRKIPMQQEHIPHQHHTIAKHHCEQQRLHVDAGSIVFVAVS